MMSLINTNDKIFIAGHRGMAGSAICRRLDIGGYSNQLKVSHSDLDLTDASSVESWLNSQRPDIVILAAARVGGILANSNYPADFLLDNLKIQNNVIEYSWRSGVRRLLFLGSSCIYPKLASQPISEDSLLTAALEPTNEWYAVAKIAGIQLCRALRLQHGFDAISLMPTNLYGPGDNYHPTNSHVLPALIRRFHEAKTANDPEVTCWGSGKPRREFLHVDDLADAAVFCLEHWKPSAQDIQFLNVGTGSDNTIQELAEKVAESVGYQGSIRWDKSKPDGTPRKLLDVSRLQKLGWTASIPLDKGLGQTIDEYIYKVHEVNSEVRL